jgi:hypothetical protein
VGLFRSLRDMKRQADQLNQGWDPAAQVQDAQARMSQATESMARQAAAANVATTGSDATATIVAVREGLGMVNFQPLIEVDLTVTPDGLPPYPATVRQVIPQTQASRAQVGAIVNVKVDPSDRSTIWIDWASPAG